MAAGYELNSGKYDQSFISAKEIKRILIHFFEKKERKESTYKYAMFKSILDCISMASVKTHKITFDSLYCRFAEIYWVLVFKHRIPQKAPSVKIPETLAEKIVKDCVLINKIKRKTSFSDLPNSIRYDLTVQMKKKCSKYVFGALYAETDRVLFSFSKENEWIKLNPLVVDYARKHMNALQLQNYKAWAKFYTDIVQIGGDELYYQRLLKREFGNNAVMLCENPNLRAKKSRSRKNGQVVERYDSAVANKVRLVLQRHPDIGLYLAQISEKIGEDKVLVKQVLDNSFWSIRTGSRYYYQDILDADIVNDAIFEEDAGDEEAMYTDGLEEPDAEYLELLKNPELLINKLKTEKEKKSQGDVWTKSDVLAEDKNPVSTKSMQKHWDREEVVILVAEYFNTKNLSCEEITEAQKRISDFLRKREEVLTGQPVDATFRNFAGIRMQYGRVRCLDPDSDLKGMQATKLQREVFAEYMDNPEKIRCEMKEIYRKYQC